jgi:outer membrane immunogenic protein
MKKGNLLVLGLAFLIAMNGHAAVRNGIYGGAGIGAAFDHYDLTTSNIATGFTVNSNANKTNLIGNAFIGYGYTADNCFYLGGELGTNFPKRSITINGRPGVVITPATFNDTLRIQDYVTGDLLPGYRIDTSWLVYGRVGITYSRLSVNQDANVSAGTPSFSDGTMRVGGRLGAGINYSLSNNLGLGVDYYYTFYQSKSTNWSTFLLNFNQKPYTNFVGLSLFYSI